VAADFISRRALAPVFDGNQKSAARLIGQRQFVKNRCIFRCFLPIDVCDSATTVALARSRGLQPTVRLQTIRKAPIGALGPNSILSVV